MALEQTLWREDVLGPGRVRVMEVYECPRAEAPTHVATLRAATPSGYAEPSPWASQITSRPFRAKLAQITAIYQTPTLDQWLRKNTNYFVVFSRVSTVGEMANVDRSGNTLSGIDPTDTSGVTLWKVVKGLSIVFRPKVTYYTRGYITDHSWFDDDAVDVGCINSNTVTKLKAHQDPGELLFAGLVMNPDPYKLGLWQMSHILMGMDGGWNKSVTARKFVRRIQQVPKYDVNNELIPGETKDIAVLAPTDTTVTAELFEKRSFAGLNSRIAW